MYFTAHNHQVTDIKFNCKIVIVQKKVKGLCVQINSFFIQEGVPKPDWNSFDFHLFLPSH